MNENSFIFFNRLSSTVVFGLQFMLSDSLDEEHSWSFSSQIGRNLLGSTSTSISFSKKN